MSRYARDTLQNRGITMGGHHSRIKTCPQKEDILYGASRELAGIQTSAKPDSATWIMVQRRMLQTTSKVSRWKRKKNSRKKKGSGEDGVTVHDTKENASD